MVSLAHDLGVPSFTHFLFQILQHLVAFPLNGIQLLEDILHPVDLIYHTRPLIKVVVQKIGFQAGRASRIASSRPCLGNSTLEELVSFARFSGPSHFIKVHFVLS